MEPSEKVILEQAIRDLTGLLALPTLWAGRDGLTVLQVMIEAAERIVPLGFAFAQTYLHTDKPLLEMLRVQGRYVGEPDIHAWRSLAAGWGTSSLPDGRPTLCDTPLGQLRVIRISMGYGTYGGKIWFGSFDPGFPGFTQLAFLRAASSLAATGLQAARANYEREQASRAKDEFLAMLGHELRNPLAPITTALELLKLRESGGLPREYHIIERQARHLSRLVDDLLDVTRITRGKIELRREVVDLKLVLARALEDTGLLFVEQQHALDVELPEESVWVYGDAVRLAQVFSNLLTNAAKYTDPGGHVKVRLQAGGLVSRVSVQDNGSGISPDLLPRLFNSFEQGSATIERSKGGLGIGLALVKNFVELHGGSVTVASDGVGKGSEFTVILPVLSNDRQPQAPISTGPGHEAGSGTRAARILLVDDNADALNSISQYLSYRGHDVRATGDPIEALSIAADFHPEVAVLDIGLPVMDGYALAGELRKRAETRGMRLIALTGYGQAKDAEKSLAEGFDVHLVKPVQLVELDRAIAERHPA
ncbi:MAG TPA: ATP-binding protein [Noviherbaspirillum sp.]|uniref:hybrid sensor histidine kinase/response regulator n=1 Tax=Noviherbaspirillum sp. TaxID=1926288 RepID=UPI002DDC915B|nr:ATP-binding protein [Noviherbaspirillum sp.]HEV2612623.1 ATP-binding protein [Noviherbaspirillum sp.]